MGEVRTEVTAIALPMRAKRDDASRPREVALWVLTACALGIAVVFHAPWWAHATIAASVILLGALAAGRRRSARFKRRPRAFVTIDAERILRSRGGSDGACIVKWDEPFGVAVLANTHHSRALFAFTSRERTRFVPVKVETPADADAARAVFEHAVSVADSDLEVPDWDSCLSGASAATLLAEVMKRSPASVGRIYLFDSGGGTVALEGKELRVRDKVIDLNDALEWRSFTFHETGALGMTLYQATWARQGATEFVLVCPIPAELSHWGLSRSPGPAPAREHRVAVDRAFMIPLRVALERAPRMSRASAPNRQGPRAIRT